MIQLLVYNLSNAITFADVSTFLTGIWVTGREGTSHRCVAFGQLARKELHIDVEIGPIIEDEKRDERILLFMEAENIGSRYEGHVDGFNHKLKLANSHARWPRICYAYKFILCSF